MSGQIYGAACESLFGLSPSHWNQSGFQGLCRFLINRGVSLQANFNVQSLTHVPLDQVFSLNLSIMDMIVLTVFFCSHSLCCIVNFRPHIVC